MPTRAQWLATIGEYETTIKDYIEKRHAQELSIPVNEAALVEKQATRTEYLVDGTDTTTIDGEITALQTAIQLSKDLMAGYGRKIAATELLKKSAYYSYGHTAE